MNLACKTDRSNQGFFLQDTAFDQAARESGNMVVLKVKVRVKQHLCGPFIISQRADLSWWRCSSCSREVSCQLKLNVHPSVGREPCLIDKTFGQGQQVCVGVCVCGGGGGGGAAAGGPMSNHPSPDFHSGQPEVGGGNLHASVESNHYRHILLLNITLGTVNM